jgi:hypothetical protein
MLMPLILCVSIGLLGAVTNHFKQQRLSVSDQVNRFIQTVVFVMNVSFTMQVVTLAQPFNCFQRSDGLYYLYSEQSRLCFDSEWNRNVQISSIYFILYLGFIPGFCGAALYKNRSNLDDALFRKRFGQLVAPYRVRYFWWEIVVIARKILLGLTFQVFGSFLSKTGQVFMIILVLFGFMFLDIVKMPGASLHDNVLNIV